MKILNLLNHLKNLENLLKKLIQMLGKKLFVIGGETNYMITYI